MPYVGAGFLTALRALSQADQWHVRNSGMLLLAALLERALRHRRTREDHDAHRGDDANGIGVRDFFGRAPALLAFLTDALARADTATAAARTTSRGDGGASGSRGGGGAGGVAQLDPFPMLLLLSRLVPSPSTAEEGTSARSLGAALAALVPLVQACGASRHLRVRQTAALALVPLSASRGLETRARRKGTSRRPRWGCRWALALTCCLLTGHSAPPL